MTWSTTWSFCTLEKTKAWHFLLGDLWLTACCLQPQNLEVFDFWGLHKYLVWGKNTGLKLFFAPKWLSEMFLDVSFRCMSFLKVEHHLEYLKISCLKASWFKGLILEGVNVLSWHCSKMSLFSKNSHVANHFTNVLGGCFTQRIPPRISTKG